MTKILARPAFRSPNGLSTSLFMARALNQFEDVQVFEFESLIDVFRIKPDIILLHWPDNIIGRNFFTFFAMVSGLALGLGGSKALFRTKIVWVGHNVLESHFDHKFRRWIFWKLFLPLVDAIIFPLPTLAKITRARFQNKRKIVLPFGPYDTLDENRATTDKIKKEICYEENVNYVLWFGLIRRYKNIERIIRCFEEMPEGSSIRLLVIGRSNDPEYISELRSLARKTVVVDRFIEDEEFPSLMSIVNACVFDYKKISNSGSIRMALSYNKIVFCNYFEHFEDFNTIYKTNMLRFYRNEDELLALIKDLESIEKEKILPDWTDSNWSRFAEEFRNDLIVSGR